MNRDFQTPLIPESHVDSCHTMVPEKPLCPSSDRSRMEIPDDLLLPKWNDSGVINKRPMFYLRPRPSIVDSVICKKIKIDQLRKDTEKCLSLKEVEAVDEEESMELPIFFQEYHGLALMGNTKSIILKPKATRQWCRRFQVDDRETKNIETIPQSLTFHTTLTEEHRVV